MSAMSGGQAGYYIELSRREDYYLEGGEPSGRWFGEGAERLGLSGEVSPDHLYNLFDGLSPCGRVSLVQRQRHEGKAGHRPGWDCTFSAPKSLSALLSQSDEPTRRAIQDVHHQAVEAALGYLQDTAASTRRGKGGSRLERSGIAAAIFEHSTSRALDPQLHSHCLIMNLSVRRDGTTGTLSSLDLFLSKMAAGALYRTELAKGLQDLGLLLRREKAWFEVEGVSARLVESFSKRRAAIEQAMAESGLSSAKSAAVAATRTRTAKEGVSRADLFQEWGREGERVGWGRAQAQAMFGGATPPRDSQAEARRACERATERLTQDEAHFTERDFVRYLAEESQTRGLGAVEVRRAAEEYLGSSPEIVRLGEHRGQQRFSTSAMILMEKALLETAQAVAGESGHRIRAQTAVETFSRYAGTLSEEQLRAAWHLTTETGGLAVVSGMAGTGKTTMLSLADEVWRTAGYRVLGATISARAAKELEEGSGIESDTVARTLLDLDRKKGRSLDERTVLVIDEAGMVATPEFLRLLKEVHKAGSKLILVGDERQLQPIGPGAPFLELAERHGRADLVDVRRQKEAWARQAVKDMAAGDSAAALQTFAEKGLLTFAETRTESIQELVTAWRKDGIPSEETLLLASTTADVDALNRAAQAARMAANELGSFSTEIEGQRMHEGDRIMFTKNRRTLGIQNGARGTIRSVSGDGERVAVTLDTGDRVTIEVADYPHLRLGYASTVHKAQGATTTRAYVLGGGPMESREIGYVETSRAREGTRIVSTGGGSVPDEDFERLVREMSRSRQKSMAHTVIREQGAKGEQDPSPTDASRVPAR